MKTLNFPTAKINLARNDAGEKKVGTVDIYGQIGSDWFGEGVDPAEFKRELDALGDDLDILEIRIHSYGGYVYEGQAIKTAIRRHKAEKHIFVDGMAASMASSILMEGDRRYCAKNATVMIHDPLTIAIGSLADIRKAASLLEKIKEQILDDYADKSTLSRDEISEMMSNDTYMTAQEALEWGFVDTIGDEIEFNAENHNIDIPGYQAARNERNPSDFRAAAQSNFHKLAPAMAFFNLSAKPETTQEFVTMGTKNQQQQQEPGSQQQQQPTPTPAAVPAAATDDAVAAARQAERDRINGIRDLSQPGVENLVEELCNSDTSLGDAALKIAKAVKEHNAAVATAQLDQRRNASNNTVETGGDNDTIQDGVPEIAEDDYDGQWDNNVGNCQSQYASKENHAAYMRAMASGRVKHLAPALQH